MTEVKNDVKAKIVSDENFKIFTHVSTLIKQGHFLELTHLEQNDATWKSYIYNLPRGTMKFLLNASIDTLPTKTNLKLWGKVSNDKCHCGIRQTLNHILNGCKKSLEDGRFTFRHDNILTYISKCIDTKKFKMFIDIEGFQTPAQGTIPPQILVTNLKPDIVILDQKKQTVNIFELTVPYERRIEISHKLKMEKYQHFSKDISRYKTSVTPFEVGSSTGYISRENKGHIRELHKFCKENIKLKIFNQNISAISVLSSYYIFNCRNLENWSNSEPILAPFADQ